MLEKTEGRIELETENKSCSSWERRARDQAFHFI